MIKSFKIRIYPTKEQEALMWKHINCSRYVWNYMLSFGERESKETVSSHRTQRKE